jgi:hypothetical protein
MLILAALLAQTPLPAPEGDPMRAWQKCMESYADRYAPLDEPASVIARNAAATCAPERGAVRAGLLERKPDYSRPVLDRFLTVLEEALESRMLTRVMDARLALKRR